MWHERAATESFPRFLSWKALLSPPALTLRSRGLLKSLNRHFVFWKCHKTHGDFEKPELMLPSPGLHHTCSEWQTCKWGELWHPLANEDRNINQSSIFLGGTKAALATDSERSWDDALSGKVWLWELRLMHAWFRDAYWYVDAKQQGGSTFPFAGMQRPYCEGVAAQDTPGFFVGNDSMGRGRGGCSFEHFIT